MALGDGQVGQARVQLWLSEPRHFRRPPLHYLILELQLRWSLPEEGRDIILLRSCRRRHLITGQFLRNRHWLDVLGLLGGRHGQASCLQGRLGRCTTLRGQ